MSTFPSLSGFLSDIEPISGAIKAASVSGLLQLGGSPTDYEQLINLPHLNHRPIIGNITLEEIGVQPAGNYILTEELQPLSQQEITLIFEEQEE